MSVVLRAVFSRRGICLTASAVVLAGCGGGTLGSHAFTKDVEAVQSLAAEGALVAKQVAHGDVTETFVRVHTTYLERQASTLERKLSTARVGPSLAGKRRRAVRVAAVVDRDLGLLHRHPGDRALGERLSAELERAVKQAEELAG
jgi:hypothetical protein